MEHVKEEGAGAQHHVAKSLQLVFGESASESLFPDARVHDCMRTLFHTLLICQELVRGLFGTAENLEPIHNISDMSFLLDFFSFIKSQSLRSC